MKVALFLVSIAFALIVLSSEGHAQTTLEEYNYVTKGYKVQIESGLDMKKGYKFEDIHTISIKYSDGGTDRGSRDTEFKALYRDGQLKPAAILCIYTRTETGLKDYICIPQFTSSRELWDMTLSKISSIEAESGPALMWSLAKLSAYYSMK